MTKTYSKLIFDTGSEYIADDGTLHKFRSRWVVPPGMSSAAVITNIGNETGAVPVTPTTPNTICPDAGFTPRRLKFVFPNGGSFSVPIGDRTALITARDNIITQLNGLGAAFQPACIQLIGEVRPDITDDYRPAGFTLTAGTGSAPTGAAALGKQYFYKGTMAYLSDAIAGGLYYLPFKLATESATGAAPALFNGVLTGANNNVVPVAGSLKPCRGANVRTPRRFFVTSLITSGGGTPVLSSQSTQIPETSNNPGAIQQTATDIAAITSTQCLGYAGESNNRFHKV